MNFRHNVVQVQIRVLLVSVANLHVADQASVIQPVPPSPIMVSVEIHPVSISLIAFLHFENNTLMLFRSQLI